MDLPLISSRSFNASYIVFDLVLLCIWILILIAFYPVTKRGVYFSLIGLFGYYAIDYGIYYALQGTRKFDSKHFDPAVLLLWICAVTGALL